MAEQIRVLLIEPGEHPRLVTVEHTLENLQELVGGTIQAVYPFLEPVAVICDDEGKYKGYTPNRALVDEEGEPYDIVVGTFFICGLSEDSFNSISDELAEQFKEKFFWPELFIRTLDKHVLWIKQGSGVPPKMIV